MNSRMYDDSFTSALKRGYFNMPIAIRTIISINVVVFIIQALGGPGLNGALISYLGYMPEWGTAATQPWRLVTYMFLHGSFLHLLFNMLWLWWMGRPVESQLGPRNFLVLFLGSGIGGALINLLFSGLFLSNITIGASGAVFGIMVSFAFIFPRTPIMLLFLPPIEARFLVAGLIAFDMLFIASADNVARIVHLGGAFSGYVLLRLYYRGYNYDLWMESFGKKLKRDKNMARKKKTKMHSVSEAEIIEEYDQSELDRILDIISKKGYEGLSEDEKRILFELSKKNK
ncbi:MAG: rhomboid family intramembrane serine protease [Balneolales bacterium]